jgi:uncharacterized iron-regulated membrane protein
MKTPSANARRAWTRLDTVGLLFILAVLAALFFYTTGISNAHVWRHQCVNNLAETGRAFSAWQKDHGEYYPKVQD